MIYVGMYKLLIPKPKFSIYLQVMISHTSIHCKLHPSEHTTRELDHLDKSRQHSHLHAKCAAVRVLSRGWRTHFPHPRRKSQIQGQSLRRHPGKFTTTARTAHLNKKPRLYSMNIELQSRHLVQKCDVLGEALSESHCQKVTNQELWCKFKVSGD